MTEAVCWLEMMTLLLGSPSVEGALGLLLKLMNPAFAQKSRSRLIETRLP